MVRGVEVPGMVTPSCSRASSSAGGRVKSKEGEGEEEGETWEEEVPLVELLFCGATTVSTSLSSALPFPTLCSFPTTCSSLPTCSSFSSPRLRDLSLGRFFDKSEFRLARIFPSFPSALGPTFPSSLARILPSFTSPTLPSRALASALPSFASFTSPTLPSRALASALPCSTFKSTTFPTAAFRPLGVEERVRGVEGVRGAEEGLEGVRGADEGVEGVRGKRARKRKRFADEQKEGEDTSPDQSD